MNDELKNELKILEGMIEDGLPMGVDWRAALRAVIARVRAKDRKSNKAVSDREEEIAYELMELCEKNTHGPDLYDALFKYRNALLGIKV